MFPVSPPPNPRSGYRVRQTLGAVHDVNPPVVCLPERVFDSQAAFRRWLNSAQSLAHITRLVGRRLTLRTVIVAGSKVAARRADGRARGWSRFALDGVLAPAGSRECEEFLEQLGEYGGLDGAALVAPHFWVGARRLIDEHTEKQRQVPVFAVEYTCVRDPAAGSFGMAMRLVAGFSALTVRQSSEGARQDFWAEVAEHLYARGISNYSLALFRTESLRIPIHIRRYSSVRISAFTRFRRLAIGVVVPTTGPYGPGNAAALAAPGCLSLPGFDAPKHIRRARHEAHYFILAKVPGVGVRPDIDPAAVAQMLVELKKQAERALKVE